MKKILQRDIKNKVIGGVCSGLGNYFEMDPILFRAIFLALLFAGGGGLLLYAILWIVLSENNQPFVASNSNTTAESNNHTDEEQKPSNPDNVNIIMGLILLSSGILLLVNNLVPNFDFYKFWPLILLVVGGGLLFGQSKTKGDNENLNESANEESK